MALTRAGLREMGITEKEIIDAVMAAHGETVEAAKEKAKETAESAMQKTIDALQAKVDSLPEPDGNDWETKYNELNKSLEQAKKAHEDEVTAHNATKTAHAAEKDAADIDGKIAAQLKAAGMNEKAIPKALKLYDRAIVERDKDGEIKNKDKVVESFKSEWADFFGTVEKQGSDIGKPPASPPARPTGHKDMNAWIRGTVE